MIREQYYKWLCKKVFTARRRHYKRLVKYLHSVQFTYTISSDRNRYEDGIDLRGRFAYEKGYDEADIFEMMDDDPCSVFEMMVALAVRCEEHIMEDLDIGDRTNQWFWVMIDSSGLDALNDANFNSSEAEIILNRILNREYGPCGEGGLFFIPGCNHDLRETEIWYQLAWYLNYYEEANKRYEDI